MVKAPFDNELVRSLATLLNENDLSEIEYESEGTRVRVARTVQSMPVYAAAPAPQAGGAPAPQAAPASRDEDPALHPGAIKSPMVGVVYFSPEPGAKPFVSVGDQVREGQTLCLIEAMKTFNPIHAQRGGTVERILIEDGQPVEYGEPLLIVV